MSALNQYVALVNQSCMLYSENYISLLGTIKYRENTVFLNVADKLGVTKRLPLFTSKSP